MKKNKSVKNKKIQKDNNKTSKIAKLPVKRSSERTLRTKEGILNKIDRFFKEVKGEIVKVKWPSQKELISATIAVIIISLVFAFFLGIVDIGVVKLLKIIIQ